MIKPMRWKLNGEFLLLPVVLLSASLVFVAWMSSIRAADLRSDIKEYMAKELVHLYPLPPGEVADAAYILGGTQESLKFKYLTVAELYKNGAIARVWVLSRPGITEYDPQIGRNLTNDEWSILELEKFGVPKEKIEIIKIEGGVFGTLKEARYISELVRLRKLKSLLLISQPYHSKRVYMSFKHFLPQEENFKLFIQSPRETRRFIEVVIELFKLKLYEYLLLT